VLTFFLVSGTALFAQPSGASELLAKKESGRIAGVVLDINEARVKGAKVIIKARDFSRAVVTGDAGEFEIGLPAGEYYFTVEANGFCRFEGELLKVKPKITEMVNIHLEVVAYDHPDACKCTSKPGQQ